LETDNFLVVGIHTNYSATLAFLWQEH